MNLRQGLMLALVGLVGLVAAGLTVGAGGALRHGPVAEAKVVSAGEGERFEWVDVFVSGENAVGAWQVELKGEGVRFVGVEGGEGGRDSEPPVYDAAALSGGERLVIGAVRVEAEKAKAPSSAAAELAAPSPAEPGEGGKRVRVARVHVMVKGRVEVAGELAALADVEGKRIGGTLELVRGEAGKP